MQGEVCACAHTLTTPAPDDPQVPVLLQVHAAHEWCYGAMVLWCYGAWCYGA